MRAHTLGLVSVAATTAALALAGCGEAHHGSAGAAPAYIVSGTCSQHSDEASCGATPGCEWRALGLACPEGADCVAGYCQVVDPCTGHADQDTCLADAAHGCAWAASETVALCADGTCSSGGFCYTPNQGGGGSGTDDCVCACPLYCPADGDCGPCECACGGGSGGGGAIDGGSSGTGCACACPACAPGETCPPCDPVCDCPPPPPLDAGGPVTCGGGGSCTCDCPSCAPGAGSCPPCQCTCTPETVCNGDAGTPVPPPDADAGTIALDAGPAPTL